MLAEGDLSPLAFLFWPLSLSLNTPWSCSAAHRVVTWPWALRAGWHLRSEVV